MAFLPVGYVLNGPLMGKQSEDHLVYDAAEVDRWEQLLKKHAVTAEEDRQAEAHSRLSVLLACSTAGLCGGLGLALLVAGKPFGVAFFGGVLAFGAHARGLLRDFSAGEYMRGYTRGSAFERDFGCDRCTADRLRRCMGREPLSAENKTTVHSANVERTHIYRPDDWAR